MVHGRNHGKNIFLFCLTLMLLYGCASAPYSTEMMCRTVETESGEMKVCLLDPAIFEQDGPGSGDPVADKEEAEAVLRRCPLHGDEFVAAVVPVHYGLPVWDEQFEENKQRLFPHYLPFVSGGCVVAAEAPQEEYIMVCPGCKAAYERYRSEGRPTGE